MTEGKTETMAVARRRTLLERIQDALAPILASKVALVGLGIVGFWVFVAIFAPLVSPYGPLTQDRYAMHESPSTRHVLGTDHLGRDLWARVVYGARTILILAPLSVFCSLVVGTTLGLTGGYFGGWVDELVMRILDAIMAFPAVLLYLIIIIALGPSALNVVIAITIAGAPGIARLVRSLTLDIRTREYIAAAELRGENPLYIMFVEILPNARGPIIVDAMLRVGYAVFAIGTLGFLGLGLPPPSPDWGSMVAKGRQYIFINIWAVLWPAVAISSLVIGLNLFADGLREETMRYQ
ncbi:ABC transporter permease [Candidatus Bipolaricaulota bacterium]|nr:ABC transporter permease [Candidatus Bipolaricaulota bacterium]